MMEPQSLLSLRVFQHWDREGLIVAIELTSEAREDHRHCYCHRDSLRRDCY